MRSCDDTFYQDAKDCAGSIVSSYAKYDSSTKNYDLSVDDVPDSDLFELACVLLNDEDRASEATGVDNPHFPKMWDSLMKALTKPQDPDSYIDFVSTWRKGLTQYFEKTMQKLIDEKISDRSLCTPNRRDE